MNRQKLNFGTDAKAFQSPERNNEEENHANEELHTLSLVYDHLNDDDKLRFAFLLYDFLSEDDRATVIELFEGMQSPKILFEVFRNVSREVDKKRLIQEILFSMRRFKTLWEVSAMCPHEAERTFLTGRGQISQEWRCYSRFCEQVMDEEIRRLYRKLAEVIKVTLKLSPEALVLHWLRANPNTTVQCFRDFVLQVKTEERVIKALEVPEETFYRITRSPCGLAVIINQEEFVSKQKYDVREGTEKDAEDLRRLWDEFDFHVEEVKNLKAAEIRTQLRTIAEKDHSQYEAFVLCILSHGTRGHILGSDFEKFETDELYRIFGDENNTLQGKPKLFVIQACQSEEDPQEQTSEQKTIFRVDCALEKRFGSDMFFLTATVPYQAALRHPESGSLFIQALIETIKEKGDKEEIYSIGREITNKTSKGVHEVETLGPTSQVPECRSSLRKKLILKRKQR